ncbi:Peptidyl-prolyl cis-trans isomerase H [Lemmus lemmus]
MPALPCFGIFSPHPRLPSAWTTPHALRATRSPPRTSGGGAQPRSVSRGSELWMKFRQTGRRKLGFYFRVGAMAVANSSPVNPVVFFDVSIGGQNVPTGPNNKPKLPVVISQCGEM